MVQHPARSRAPVAGLVCGLLAGGAITTMSAGQARPNLVLTSPAAGQVVKGTVRLAASADASGLAAIQFHVNGLPYGPRITSGACGVDWDTTARADATYVLSVVGSPASGPSVVSPAVTVRVENLAAALAPEAADVTEDSALIRWRTPVPATSRVEFGTSVAYGDSTAASAGLRVDHEVRLAGLSPRTTYHFRVHSRTASGAALASADGIFITGAPAEERPRVTALPLEPLSAADAARRKAAERARAIVEAHARGLHYLPGEVVIQFRPGTTTLAHERALMGVRSRPSAETLEWRGDLAVLRDPTQPDTRILAEQLNAQPEVLFAEPNYVMGPPSPGQGARLAAEVVRPRVDRVDARDLAIALMGVPAASALGAELSGAHLMAWPGCAAEACSVDALAAGIESAAANGAHVISVGLVGPAPSRALRSAILFAVSRGALVLIAHDRESSARGGHPVVDATSIAGAVSIASAEAGATGDAEIATPGGLQTVIRQAAALLKRGASDPAALEAALVRLLTPGRKPPEP